MIGVWGLCVFVSRVCFFWFGLWSVTTTRETQMITATTCLLILHAVEVASRTKGQGSCQGLQTKSTLRRVYTSWVAHLLNDISFGVTGGHCVLHDKTCHISVTSEECCDLLVTCHCAMRPWAISRQSGEVRTIICGQWSFLRITQCLSSSPCLLADSRIAKQVRSQCIGVTIAWQINESYLLISMLCLAERTFSHLDLHAARLASWTASGPRTGILFWRKMRSHFCQEPDTYETWLVMGASTGFCRFSKQSQEPRAETTNICPPQTPHQISFELVHWKRVQYSLVMQSESSIYSRVCRLSTDPVETPNLCAVSFICCYEVFVLSEQIVMSKNIWGQWHSSVAFQVGPLTKLSLFKDTGARPVWWWSRQAAGAQKQIRPEAQRVRKARLDLNFGSAFGFAFIQDSINRSEYIL